MAVLLALLSSLVWGSSDFVGGLRARVRPAIAVVAGSQLFGLTAVAVVALASGAHRGPLGWLPWACVAGVVGSTALVCFYAALGSGTMGVVAPIAALGAVVPVLIGLAGGERPTALVVAGLVLALAGGVAASGPELGGGASLRPVLLAVVAGIGFGFALVAIGRGARYDSLMTLTGMRLTSVTGFVLLAVATRSVGGLQRSDLPWLATVGVGDVAANLLYATATRIGLLSVTSVLGSLYSVVTVLLAWRLLGERLRRIQLVGVVLALAGVALVALGRTG